MSHSSKQKTALHTPTEIADIWKKEHDTLIVKYAQELVNLEKAQSKVDKSAPEANENILSLLIRMTPRLLDLRQLRLKKEKFKAQELRLTTLLRARISGMANTLSTPNSTSAKNRISYFTGSEIFRKKAQNSNNTAEGMKYVLLSGVKMSLDEIGKARESIFKTHAQTKKYKEQSKKMQVSYLTQELEIIQKAANKDPSSPAAAFITYINDKNLQKLREIEPPPLNGETNLGLTPKDGPLEPRIPYKFGASTP